MTVSGNDGAPPANNDVTVRVVPTPIPPARRPWWISPRCRWPSQGPRPSTTRATTSCSPAAPRATPALLRHRPAGAGRALDTAPHPDLDRLAQRWCGVSTCTPLIAGKLRRQHRAEPGGKEAARPCRHRPWRRARRSGCSSPVRPGGPDRHHRADRSRLRRDGLHRQISIVPPPTAPTISRQRAARPTAKRRAVPVDAAIAVSDANNLWAAGDVRVQITAGAEASDPPVPVRRRRQHPAATTSSSAASRSAASTPPASAEAAPRWSRSTPTRSTPAQAVARAIMFDTPARPLDRRPR